MSEPRRDQNPNGHPPPATDHPPTPAGAAKLRRVALGAIVLEIVHPADPMALMENVDPEEFARDERIPYWADIWPAAVALGRHLLELDLRGARVIELGAGVGLAGLAAARAGADVLVTDYEEIALHFARANAARNGLAIRTAVLDWRDADWPGGFDLAIAADVLYEARNIAPIAALLPRLIAPGGRALVTDAGRPYVGTFMSTAAAHGLAAVTRKLHIYWEGRTRAIDLVEVTPM
jgi:predicted nicotinamide N-methyase